ncbi:MAG: nickel pincer cofactor biosynthesis protein LarB [Candidatus Nitronauta litoralis]|uniref:Nickel pincer cofactor biosynthesis protein LarB n=1 Tax=Candidatus Nitronauta litoralis TaxID=2705533 RepID=A0A7T0BYU2_9BACT|nr:MAG: nickel pincer cofactor biosynthesis protein LarB [Candidatus Nitronauta litoralis]
MKPEEIKNLLDQVARGKVSPDKALDSLKNLPFEDISFARLDHHRELRSGIPEVVYCEGKSVQQLKTILKKLCASGQNVLATRLDEEVYKKLKSSLPSKAQFHKQARLLVLKKKKVVPRGKVAVVTAGTSDIPIAEEAAITLETLGTEVERVFDVGVAGLHRLLAKLETLRKCRVIIAVAGMEGALVSVLGGLVEQPVIGVPTSVGYGASFEGLAPLLTMLNSCSTGIGVVNIDNGFGAACLAHKINLLGES